MGQFHRLVTCIDRLDALCSWTRAQDGEPNPSTHINTQWWTDEGQRHVVEATQMKRVQRQMG